MGDEAENKVKRPWLWTVQKETVALRLWEGKTYDEIIQEFGLSSRTIAAWKKEPEFDARLKELDEAATAEATRILRRAVPRAARRLVDIMEFGTSQHGMRLAAAKDILDRSGLKPVQEIKQENTGHIEVEYVNDWRQSSE